MTRPNLIFLYAGNNHFRSLPESICQLTNLECMYIGGNLFENFSTSISQFINLNQIDIW